MPQLQAAIDPDAGRRSDACPAGCAAPSSGGAQGLVTGFVEPGCTVMFGG